MPLLSKVPLPFVVRRSPFSVSCSLGTFSAKGGLSAVITCLRADWVVAACGSQGLRHCREVAAYDLPITTLFDKHQRGSPVQRQGPPVLGRSHKRVIRVHDADGVVVHAARWLPEAETRRG